MTYEFDRRGFMKAAALASVAGVPSGSSPNILVIRADQLRKHELGCYGNVQAITPNIDALATAGRKFNRAYCTAPVCSASRVSFDLGKYPHALPNLNKLHPGDRTLHGLLQNAGYYTWHIGKWHKTPSYLSNSTFPQSVPSEILRGLDYHAGHEFKHELVNSLYYKNGGSAQFQGGPWRSTKYEALAEVQIGAAMGLGRPFYGVLDLEPPHTPLGEINGTKWDVFNPSAMPVRPNVNAASLPFAQKSYAQYYGMTHSVDEQVGDMMGFLQSSGLLANTVVFFTSDHGAHLGSHGHFAANAQKRTMYEEALRIPLIYYDGSAPSENDELFGIIDFAPMILTLAGVASAPGLHSFKKAYGGALYIQELADGPEAGAFRGIVRDDGMKYARAAGTLGPWILYDSVADPYDETNLVGTGDPREAEMDVLLYQAAGNIGDVIPW